MGDRNQLKAFLDSIPQQAKRQSRNRKSDDIIEFIKKYWRLFCSSRYDMRNAVEQLGTTVPYSVDALCDLLGVPTNVLFKKVKVIDTSAALLDFEKSELFNQFVNLCQSFKSGEVCLFAVAGQRSLIITNMQTDYVEGRMHLLFKSMGNLPDIHVFRPEDAPLRIPTLFDHTI
jgi:hypothetical protein